MIDTRDRRSSAIGLSLPWRSMYPVPDGLPLVAQDRQHVSVLYRGIAAFDSGPTVIVEYCNYYVACVV